MKKIIILLLILVPFISHARVIKLRAVTANGFIYACDEVRINQKTGKQYCYIGGKSKGLVTLEESTNLKDTKGITIYEGDTVSTPGLPNAVVTFGSNHDYLGFYLNALNIWFPFSDITINSNSKWSTVIK